MGWFRAFVTLQFMLATACVTGRSQPAGPHTQLACGSPELADRSARAARVYLFPDPVERAHLIGYAAQLRAAFYPGLRPGHEVAPETDRRMCQAVLAALAQQRPGVVETFRGPGDTLGGERRFAILRIGPHYHVTTLPTAPTLDGGVSYVAPRRTLQFRQSTHQQF